VARPKLDIPNYRLKLRGRHYYAIWHQDGRYQRISTGTADQREAQRFLAQLIAGLNTPEPPRAPTVAEILDGYLADRRQTVRSPQTLEYCAKALKRHLGDLQPDHLTKERARFYVSRRKAEGYKVGPQHDRRRKPVQDGTILRELLTLRAAIRWAIEEKWPVQEPYIPVPRQPRPRERWLNREEADRLIAAAQAFHIKVFLMLALHTAARRQALLELRWDQVDFEAGLIDLGWTASGKNRAVVPMNDELRSILEEARAAATCPHVVEFAGQKVADVKTGTRAAAMRAGLPGVTPHVLRHTAATWMAMARIAMREISIFLGHSSEHVTENVYAKYSPDYLRRAAKALEKAEG
jgi:integrase